VEGGEEVVSDFLLGAIVGGGFSLLVSVVTLLIQGHFSKTTIKTQIDAQAKEARLNRLVEVRAQYLNPLRDQVAKIYEQLIKIIDQMIAINVRYGNPPDPTRQPLGDYDKEIAKLPEALDKLKKALAKAKIMRSQTSDHRLTKLFLDFAIDSIKLERNVLLLEGIPLKWIPKSGEEKNYDFEKATDKVILLQVILEDINGRIEHLLSGGNEGDN